MNGVQPGNTMRQVLELGEDLLFLAHQAVSADSPAHEALSNQGQQIARSAARLLHAPACLWLTRDLPAPEAGQFAHQPRRFQAFPTEPPAQAGEGSPPPSTFSPLALAAIERAQTTCGADSQSGPFFDTDDIEKDGRAPHALAALLRLRDGDSASHRILGVLQVDRPPDAPFTRPEIELLEALATQSALGLQSSLSLLDERWRSQQLALVRQVSLQIASLRDLDEIAPRTTQIIQQTFDFYYVALFTLDPGQNLLRFRASAASDRASLAGAAKQTVRICVGEGIVGHVAQTGQEVLARNVAEEPLYRHVDQLPETRSEVGLPLKVQDRLLGVLDVQSNELDDFDEMDMLVLRTLAGNLAVAIDDAALYRALTHRAGQLEAIYAVSSAITSILDQETLLNEVASLIQSRFGYPYVHLYSVHPGRRRVFYEAGTHGQGFKQREFSYDLDDPLGLVPWVARSGMTILSNDVSQEARYRPSEEPPDNTRSELVVPLVFGGDVLGVLDVQSDQLDAFGEEDRFLFEALADHVSIALRNAALYRSEVWRRRVADSMREVAGLLSADADLDHILEAILQELAVSLPLEAAALWLLDEDAGQEDPQGAPLHLGAAYGSGIAALDLELGLTPEEIWEDHVASRPNPPTQPAWAWLRQALAEEDPLARGPASPFEPLGAALGFPPDYSALAVPLRVGSQILGLLVLTHRTAGRYGSEARAMSAAFASYAAVAIENTRMYEAAHEQAWVSTVLLQVAEATQSQVNLNELLNTVIRITPLLAGVKACLLYILDEDGDFLPAAASGLDGDQQAEFERWRFAPGDVPALDHLQAQRHPIILHGDEDDRNLTSILYAGQGQRPPDEMGLAVLVPLLARGEVLGAFVVDYNAGPVAISGKSLEAFFDERLAILQGIAHQTAVAVDNIRLLKAQKEEAYVSVALLQVAQAVVSSNDLDEALGSIVRITPILVGVKRAMIYLWDEARRSFRLAQAYGVARAAEAHTYALGAFPLLDAVLLEDTLLAYPLWEDVSQAENVPAAWAGLEPPDVDRVDEYLENAACLLIAFPLSVKGKVLGVFLVEEPDRVAADSFAGGSANRRLRGKRLEIITGISQQAALAVQNDQLQREMVQQERLAREMQLAREIQNAFLPQIVPQLPGWDLRVRWRTAREVGGDFYDFFDLPGNRLGLVIADVADKGMPAALFMTLVRTLVRATMQEIDSPSDVLDRVNDIIVPEAPRGMFVTILYAVLDLDTGEMEYANAGHNPALVLRAAACQVERLERSGMALGVQEGNHLLKYKLRLAPGDYVVFYTDGVTEAVSAEGDFFGEQRLHALVQNAACQAALPPEELTADEMLNQIDSAVQDFVGQADPSDDLTLLVLKRSL